jgi:hypothetical protein
MLLVAVEKMKIAQLGSCMKKHTDGARDNNKLSALSDM